MEEYESLRDFLTLLKKFDIKSAIEPLKELVRNYGDIFERCDTCEDTLESCTCNHDYYNDRGSIFDDESSFE